MLLARARPGAAANRLPLHHFLRLIAGGRMMEHGAPACLLCGSRDRMLHRLTLAVTGRCVSLFGNFVHLLAYTCLHSAV